MSILAKQILEYCQKKSNQSVAAFCKNSGIDRSHYYRVLKGSDCPLSTIEKATAATNTRIILADETDKVVKLEWLL